MKQRKSRTQPFSPQQETRMRQNINELHGCDGICAPIAKIYCGDVEMLLIEIERLQFELDTRKEKP